MTVSRACISVRPGCSRNKRRTGETSSDNVAAIVGCYQDSRSTRVGTFRSAWTRVSARVLLQASWSGPWVGPRFVGQVQCDEPQHHRLRSAASWEAGLRTAGRAARWRESAGASHPPRWHARASWWHFEGLRGERDGWPWSLQPVAKVVQRLLPCVAMRSRRGGGSGGRGRRGRLKFPSFRRDVTGTSRLL